MQTLNPKPYMIISVPQAAMGSIIGAGGKNLKHVRKAAGAKVETNKVVNPPQIWITGTEHQCEAFQAAVENALVPRFSPSDIQVDVEC